MMISMKRLRSRVCARPAASASSVLPLPAGPSSVTKSISGSISRLSAKFCSRLRAVMPQTLWRSLRKSRASSSVADAPLTVAHDRLDALRTGFVDEQVRPPAARGRTVDLIPGAVAILPRAHVLAVAFPEVRRQRLHAGIEHVGVFDGLVAVVVLGMHADDRGLDAQVDVLGHQRDARLRGSCRCSDRVCPRIRLSTPTPGRPSGSPPESSRVWKNRRPAGGFLPWLPL